MTARPSDLLTPEVWSRVNELFAAASELDGAAVRAFLDRATEGEPELRGQVERLLGANARAGRFLATSPLADMAPLFAPVGPNPPAIGRKVGAYRLVEELGQGGMGTVYVAERADDAYRKRVAIKIIRPGLDSSAVLERFRTERQILASLEHPNIARLFDGGTTDDGTPYVVMELIEGQPIDEYCAAHDLSIARRLELFLLVGNAVAHAHQRLVVHRDIKPSNILVGPDGTPKLLDFGIARILDPERGAESTATLALMTPAYASPEQVQALPATTLTDVYSLGVVLYELLAGRPPYEVSGLPPHEVARVICTAEPSPPSVHGARRLRGDLDNIALMALRKDPARRYGSVEQLCEDVRRHLTRLPVSARQETFAYRAGKFVRRHRAEVAAAVLVLVTLVAGVVATAWQARRALVQERIARVEQARAERRFDDVRRLARSVLFDYHDAIADLAGATPVRQRLVVDALTYLDALAGEKNDPSLQLELAAAYERVGDVQGGTSTVNLGDSAGALASYRKAIALHEAVLAAEPGSTEARRGLSLSHDKLGMLLELTGDVAGGLAELGTAMALLEPLVRSAPSDEELRIDLALLHDRTGMLAIDAGDVARARDQHLRALELYASLIAATRATTRVQVATANALEHLGSTSIEVGDLDGALEHNRRALAMRLALATAEPQNARYRSNLAVSHYNEGDILARMGRSREALHAYRQAAAIAEELFAADPSGPGPAYYLVRVGDMLARLGEHDQALIPYRRARELAAADAGTDPADLWKRTALVEAEAKVGRSLARLGQTRAALVGCDQAVALMQRTTVEPSNLIVGAALAETATVLGEAYATLAADRRATAAERRSRWSSACDAHRRTEAFWQDVARRGLLSPGDAGKPGAAADQVARCTAASTR